VVVDWLWRAATPGDRYSIVAEADGVALPYAVCKVVVSGVPRFESWRRGQALRGSGFWGGTLIGAFADAALARAACIKDNEDGVSDSNKNVDEGQP
jgi:hypothetical protein